VVLLLAGALAGYAFQELRAVDVKTFTLGNQVVVAEDITSEAPVLFRAMRFNEATEQWNVELVVTNQGERTFGKPIFLTVESFANTTGPLTIDGVLPETPPKPFLTLDTSGLLAPGKISLPRTLSLGFVEGAGAPRLQMRVFGTAAGFPYALALTRTLDDVGQPLTDVRVTEQRPNGTRTLQTDPEYGVVTLGQAPGEHTWTFEHEGHLPVWRKQTLARGAVRLIPNPRLARRNTNSVFIATGGANNVSDPSNNVIIHFPQSAGAVGAVTLTLVDGQTLPALLPQGWSPLRAFWIESTNALLSASAAIKPEGPIASNETATLAKWNAEATQWEVQVRLQGNGTNAIDAVLPIPGAYALVVPDSGALAPPLSLPGEPLRPSAPPLQPASALAAIGTVSPSSSVASRAPEAVTATASVIVTNSTGLLPSGLSLRTEVTEDYRLQDASSRFMALYETFVIAYRRPAGTSPTALESMFPMRPLLLFGPEQLVEASVRVDLLSPDIFRGAVFETSGGLITDGRLRIGASTGDFASPQAAVLRSLTSTNLPALLIPGQSIAAAFDLTVAGVEPGRRLSLQVSNLSPNRFFVLARILSGLNHNGLEPVERLRSGTNGVLSTLEPASGERLSGLRSAGQYLLVQVAGPHALISGVVNNAQGNPATGFPVRVTGQPWLTFAGRDGDYLLVAPTGAVEVAVTDLPTGDTDFVERSIVDPAVPLSIDLDTHAHGPRAIRVSPAPDSMNVNRVTPIVVTFSQPVNPGTIVGDGLRLLGTNGVAVVGSLSLNQRNTIATLLPAEPLPAGEQFTITLSTNITDLNSRKLEGPTQFKFTTLRQAARGELAKLTIFEPGATNIPPTIRSQLVGYDPARDRDVVVAFGSAGTAEAEVPVILVNDNTGETSTVLSKVDGSFAGFIRADEEDFISAVFVNANRTRTTVPATEQRFDDGHVGLYRAGGILEAESDGGPVQMIVAPGAIPTRTKFKLQLLDLTEILSIISNAPPEQGIFLKKALRLSAEGAAPTESLDVSFPVALDELQQAGVTNGTPEEAAYALVSPITIDGAHGYALLDKLEFADGRLVTRSPPFPGVIASVQATLSDLVVAPLVLATRSQPLIFTGRVLEDVASPDGSVVTGRRAVPGALVTVRPFDSPVSSRPPPGRLQNGSIVAVADAEGSYALFTPVPEFKHPTIDDPFFDRFRLTATHPRRFATQAQVLAAGVEDVANIQDIIFPAHPTGNVEDSRPARLLVFHDPTFPRPGTDATITIIATHGSDLPTVTVQKDSIMPESAPLNDVRLTEGPRQNLGPTTVRAQFTVNSKPTNVLVTFLIRGEANGAPRAEVAYPIFFRDQDVPTPDSPPADANDTTGPMVVRSIPRDDPDELAPSLAIGDPILIEFSESIKTNGLASAIQLSPSAGPPILQLSTDQRRLAIRFGKLEPNKPYTLTLTPAIVDLSGNRLDQTPDNNVTPEAFKLHFVTAREDRGGPLAGIEHGGGVVTRGIYAYVLERAGPLDGAVVVYDLSNPSAPSKVSEFSVPGFPRDLALIPAYEYKRTPQDAVETNDLIAVVGGKVGGASGDFGTLLQGFQYLWVIDISDPTNLKRLAAAAVTLSPVAAVTKVVWSPPELAYLESSADGQIIGVVNLQSMILGDHIGAGDFADGEVPGTDLNGDGDFVDPGEVLPIPSRSTVKFAGKVNAFTLPDTTQRIADFFYDSSVPYVGLALGPGKVLDSQTGLPSSELAKPAYRTLVLGQLDFLDRELASLEIANGVPKRLFALFGARIAEANNQTRSANLALVSVEPTGDGVSRVDVIEFTDPTHPRLLRSILIPSEHGIAQSIFSREDGRLLLATSKNVLVLDRNRLAEPPPSGGADPAIIGVLPGVGSGIRTFDSTLAGLNVVSSGGKNQLLQTAPVLRFIGFPGKVFEEQQGLLQPQDVRNHGDRIASLMKKRRVLSELPPAAFCTIDGIVESALRPPNLQFHYYVMVFAPGSAGGDEGTIHVALESLNESGIPLRNMGLGFPPVRAVDDLSLNGIGQRPITDWDAPIHPLTAYRLSDNKADPNYNIFLSKPFALMIEPITLEDLDQLHEEADREILWSGYFLRAYLDQAMKNNAVIGSFCGVTVAREALIRPGTSVEAITAPGDYRLGPNPATTAEESTASGSFKSVMLHNGEFRDETIDIALPSPRMPIIFKRFIGGQDLHHGSFGRGWDFNYNQRIARLDPPLFPIFLGDDPAAPPKASLCPQLIRDPDPGSPENIIGKARDVFFHNGQGRALLYRFAGVEPPDSVAGDLLVEQLGWKNTAAAYYHSPVGSFDILVQFQDQKFARLLPDGTQFWYSPVGRLEAIYDRYTNNVHVLQYDSLGLLVRIVDRSVQTERYLDIGYFKQASDPTFRAVDQAVQDLRLVGLIAKLKDYAGREVLFNYSPEGVLVRRDGIAGSLGLEAGGQNRQSTFYTYGLGGPMNSVDRTLLEHFPLANNISGIVGGDPGGQALVSAREFVNGAPVPVVKRFDGANGPVTLDLLYNNTARDLAQGNGRARLTSIDGSSTDYTLDEHGLPMEATMGGGIPAVTYQTVHTPDGLVKEIVYPLGNRVVFTYDSNNLIRRSQANLLFVDKIPNDGTAPMQAAFHYEEKYNLRDGTQTDFNGNSITYNPTADRFDVGEIIYPNVSPALPPGVGAPFTVGGGGREEFVYNDHGQIKRHVDANGIVRTYDYRTTDGFLDTTTLGESQDTSLTTTYTYGSDTQGKLGLPERVDPPRSQAAPTHFVFNEREELVSVQRDQMLSTSTYDLNGRIKRRTFRVESGRDLVETYEYEHNGFLLSRTLENVETSLNGEAPIPRSLVLRYEPDAMNRVDKIIYPGGETKQFLNYDHLGRPEGIKVGSYEEHYTYDENNNLKTITRGTAVTRLEYDGHDRLHKEFHPVTANQSEEVERTYFNSGELREMTVRSTSGQVIQHGTFQIDALDRRIVALTDSDSGVVAEFYAFDGAARIRRIASAQGEVAEIRYDDAGRSFQADDSVTSVTYQHDRNNNLEESVSHEGPTPQNAYTTTYTPYDNLDRSLQTKDDEGVISSVELYRLDGKVLKARDGRGSLIDSDFTLMGEPARQTSPTGVEFHFSYDRNRQAKLEGDRLNRGWVYDYDSALRLERHAMRDGSAFKFSQFDARNRPRRTEFPEGNPDLTIQSEYDLQGRLTTNSISYRGRLRIESTAYDALDRSTRTSFNTPVLSGTMTYRYDLLGPVRQVDWQLGNEAFVFRHDIRPDGNRTNVAYPTIAVAEERDLNGRLVSVKPNAGTAVVSATTFEAADIIDTQVLGDGVVQCENKFDLRKRLLRRTYRNAGAAVLAEIRYTYDSNNNVVARQLVHRGGRVDFFQYDADNRLVRADVGVRPSLTNAAPRQVPGFTVPTNVLPQNAWASGFFARDYQFDPEKLDRRVSSTLINPDNLPTPAFANAIGGFDDFLHAGEIDGFVRGHDSLGNTTNTLLQVRLPGSAAPVAVAATLQYDGHRQLIRIQRSDDVEIRYEYLPSGYCCYRRVSGPSNRCVPSERLFVWDGARLAEEYDLVGGSKVLRARYFYTDSDVPVAADLTDAEGVPQRHYFLFDIQGSLLAVVNGQGELVERYYYDPWGQPEIQQADTQPPVVRRIISDVNSLVIEFSETVLPPLMPSAPNASPKELAAAFSNFAASLVIQQGATAIPGTFALEESRPGSPFGTCVRFTPAAAISGNLTLRMSIGALVDEWNNPTPNATINFAFNPTPGVNLFQNLVSTAPVTVSRTFRDQPFLFHGQYFDFEAGLTYMRARFYDPFTGLFLQPDPKGYEDSVNLYAGFANNPQSFRDPSGTFVIVPAYMAIGAVIGAGVGAGIELYRQRNEAEIDWKKVGVAALGGAAGGATGGIGFAGEAIGIGIRVGILSGIASGLATRAANGEEVFSGKAILKDAAVGAAFGGALKVVAPALGALGSAVVKSRVGKALLGEADDVANDFLSGVSGKAKPALQSVDEATESFGAVSTESRFQFEHQPYNVPKSTQRAQDLAIEEPLYEQGVKAKKEIGILSYLDRDFNIQVRTFEGNAQEVSQGQFLSEVLAARHETGITKILAFHHTHPEESLSLFSSYVNINRAQATILDDVVHGDVNAIRQIVSHPQLQQLGIKDATFGVIGPTGVIEARGRTFLELQHRIDQKTADNIRQVLQDEIPLNSPIKLIRTRSP
jgi:RHS repeat-associated protein